MAGQLAYDVRGRTRTRGTHALHAVVFAIFLVLVWPAAAAGQDDPETTTTTSIEQTSTTVAPATTTSTTEPDQKITLDNDQSVKMALVALGFGVLAIYMVLRFLRVDRDRSYGLLDDASRRGQSVNPVSEAALENKTLAVETDGEPRIHGPSTVAVGQKSTYVVVGDVENQEVAWAVVGEATISASSGATTAVTASSAGGLHLTAAVGSGDSAVKLATDVMAEAPAGSTAAIPFLGRGYGTVVIALGVAAVTASLGLTKVLDGQAVAGILGSLVTYTVTRSASGNDGGDPGG